MKLNQILGVVTIILLLASIWTYRQSVTRAERFERGQKFLSQLNPDNIHQIEITKEGETVVLNRNEDEFVVASLHDYPAKNETINRFINDTLNISLEKEIGKSEKLENELEVDPEGEAGTLVALKNDAGKDMVRFMVGKTSDDGRGNFVRRLDDGNGMIYLTSKGVYLSTTADNFLDKEIVDVGAAEIAMVQGTDYVVEDVEGTLKLKDLPNGQKENSGNLGQVKSMLSTLRYDKVFLADDGEVASLNFDTKLDIQLKDESGYRVALAQKDERYFLQIEGYFNVEQIKVSQEETEEELQEKSEILSRANELQEFNHFHGSWVYELAEFTAKKFLHTKKDLIEAEKPEEEEG